MRKHVLLSLHEYEVCTQAKWPPAETYPSWYEAWYEATSSIITLPWMRWESITRSPLLPPPPPPRISSGFPNNLPMPINTPEWREALWEYSALPKNTTHWPCQVLDPDLSTQSPAHYVTRVEQRETSELTCCDAYRSKVQFQFSVVSCPESIFLQNPFAIVPIHIHFNILISVLKLTSSEVIISGSIPSMLVYGWWPKTCWK